jgi:hypothetical protein
LKTVKSVPPLIGEGMIVRKVLVRAEDVVYLKGVLDSQEGLAQVFAESGGDLVIAAPEGRAAELDALLDELIAEVGGMRG